MTTENSQWKRQQKISQFQAGNSKPVGEATGDIDMVLIVIIMPCFSFCLVAMNRWVVVPSKKQCRSYIRLSSLHFTSMLPTHIQEWQQLPQLAPKTFPLLHNFNYNANMESVLYQNVQQNRTIFSLLTDFPIYKVGTPGD